MTKKILSYLLVTACAVAVFFCETTNAASREEIAAIKVETAKDFRYWNLNSPTLNKIIKFVEEANTLGHKNYIPPKNRVAVFDMDGTIYCETAPLYFQETMFLYRALEDKNYSPTKEMRDFAAKIKPKIYNKTGITKEENEELFNNLTAAYKGMTPEEYRAYVRDFMQTNETGLTNLKRGEAFYLPMMEIMSYLGNNGFEVYIVTACSYLTTRELAEGVVPVNPNRIIGSDFGYTTTNMGSDAPDKHFYDRYKEKVIIAGTPLKDNAQSRKIFSIINQIGKKPVLAFGNSMGDSGMLEYTLQDNLYNSAAFVVLCDDTKRELGNLKKAENMKNTAISRGWNTISMRDEFKTIYGDNVKRAK